MAEKVDPQPAQAVVRIIGDVSEAKILIDPMRREILRLLAKQAQCEKDLSEILHLSAPSVGHHLKSLRHGNMIAVVRREANSQGIIQKFYLANAKAFIVDTTRLPPEIQRYFFPVDIEGVRGAMASLSHMRSSTPPLSSDMIEKMAQSFRHTIINVARSHQAASAESDPELIINGIYKEAVRQLTSKWVETKHHTSF